MGKVGAGYGSEWHLLSYLGRHRHKLDQAVLTATGATSVDWLDFPLANAGTSDAEWKGIDFIDDSDVQAKWRAFWPQGRGIQNWDAVGCLQFAGRREWLLVEAKAHIGEINSDCAAVDKGGRRQIEQALTATKASLGIAPDRDWLNRHYQYCNRITVAHFLRQNSVPARLLFVYFYGDRSSHGRDCPRDDSGWKEALAACDEYVFGSTRPDPVTLPITKLFLQAFTRPDRATRVVTSGRGRKQGSSRVFRFR